MSTPDGFPIQMVVRRPGRKPGTTFRKTTACAGDRTAISVRFKPDVLALIDAAAKAGFRSRNAEIEMRLIASLAGESIDEHGVIVRHVPGVAK